MRLVGSMCNLRARARILRIGICYGPEQERSCATNIAGCPTKGHKSLLREDHRFGHSATMRRVVRNFSDHCQPARGYRARAVQIRISPKTAAWRTERCLTRQRRLRIVSYFQLISPRKRAPTFSMGCFSLLRSSWARRRAPVPISRINSRANFPERMSRSADLMCFRTV